MGDYKVLYNKPFPGFFFRKINYANKYRTNDDVVISYNLDFAELQVLRVRMCVKNIKLQIS